jgi:Fe-S-cluster containining protein
MVDINIEDSPFESSPVAPETFDENYVIKFRCYKGIECFNACCSNIDITLTPYDIIRLKNRLGMTSSEFLKKYTIPFEIAANSIAGVKYKPVEGGTACQFMTEEGCSVYEDRPTACRYYPVGLLSMRRADENRTWLAPADPENEVRRTLDRRAVEDQPAVFLHGMLRRRSFS